MKNEPMRIVQVDVTELKPAEYNPRKASKIQCEQLKKSIQEFGLVDPIIVNSAKGRENIIVGGHFRLRIAKELGYKTVPVFYINLSDIEKEKELNLRLNKNLGEWDFNLLLTFDENFLVNAGFDSKELDNIFVNGSDLSEDDVPSMLETNIKIGDIFQLGKHRLFCEDCLISSNINKLMDNELADIVFTDPPYGINIVKFGKVGGGGKTKFGKVGGDKVVKSNFYLPIKNDDKEFNPDFLLKLSKKLMLFGGNYFANKLPNSSCWIIWDKTGDNFIQNNFAIGEIVWTNFKSPSRIFRCKWRGLNKEKGEDLRKRVHPTQKPIKLLVDILNDYTKENETILDVFGGSGSTLIACEKTNRCCRMMEIEPHYCQVIINRWEKYTGKKVKQIK